MNSGNHRTQGSIQKNQPHFCTLAMNNLKRKLREKFHLQWQLKIYTGKHCKEIKEDLNKWETSCIYDWKI